VSALMTVKRQLVDGALLSHRASAAC
jgi:hypothetical protein